MTGWKALRVLLATLAVLVSWPVWPGIVVSDDTGHQLALEKPAQRIISLAPNITEMLFSAGAGGQIVGADEYSNHPAEAREIRRVNNHAAANYELILSLEPDVVIAWRSGNGDEVIDRLRRLGVAVFVVEPRHLEDIPGILARFGTLAGSDERVAKNIEVFDDRLAGLRAAYAGRRPVRVFYQVWNEPLITLNGDHIVSDVIRLCGGVNIFADAAPLVPYVGIEAVIRADPEVIIASGSDGDARPRWLDMWARWPQIDAVAGGRIYAISPDLIQRHSMRILDGAERVCALLDDARGDGRR